MTGAHSDREISALDAVEDAKQVNRALGVIQSLFWQSRNEVEFEDEAIGDLLYLIHARMEQCLDQVSKALS